VSPHEDKWTARRPDQNALLGYYDDPPDRRITDDDLLYLDFGPVFEEWEADFGRSYVVGSDPVKHRLVADLWTGFQKGREFFNQHPDMTAGALYDYVVDFAKSAGWDFGAPTAARRQGQAAVVALADGCGGTLPEEPTQSS